MREKSPWPSWAVPMTAPARSIPSSAQWQASAERRKTSISPSIRGRRQAPDWMPIPTERWSGLGKSQT
jgi:hypothetical protein